MTRRKKMTRKSGMNTDPPSWNPPGTLGRDVQQKIGDQLRAMHDDIVNQGIPDRFVNLLNRLDETEGDKSE